MINKVGFITPDQEEDEKTYDSEYAFELLHKNYTFKIFKKHIKRYHFIQNNNKRNKKQKSKERSQFCNTDHYF